jgi:antitoxin VapB
MVYIMVDITEEKAMKTAKLFENGRSQAVRLPRECRFKGKEVYVRKYEDVVILFPKRSAWGPLLNSIDKFSDDFMTERDQPEQQVRKGL